jgi:hypothetical protein
MRPYPLRKGITREEFNRLVTDLYYRLAAKGLNPTSHLVEDMDEISDDAQNRHHFALFISEAAARILENKPN